MARPIKETPVLHGKDAARFNVEISKHVNSKVSNAEMERMKNNFSKFKFLN